MSVDLDLLPRASDRTASVSPFAPFAEVLAPPATRDYTQTPAYEMPVLARTAQKLTEMQWARPVRIFA